MSLISDALKKTQRMRTSEPAADAAPVGAMPAGRPGRGGSSGPTLVWVIAGAIVLVCIAVVITVFLVRPAATPAPALAQAKAAPAAPAANTAAPPAALSPVVTPSAPKPAEIVPSVQATMARSSPAAVPALPPAPSETSAAATVASTPPARTPPLSSAPRAAAGSPRQPPTVATAAPAGASAQPDPRIQAFIDTIKVAGIRSSGTDSKVLMNDKVFRVNDIVDRSLNLRLIEVQADSLTFVDENSVVYTKNF